MPWLEEKKGIYQIGHLLYPGRGRGLTVTQAPGHAPRRNRKASLQW